MIDTMKQERLRVLNNGAAGPYIILPFSQVEQVQELLNKHHIRYWMDDNLISLDGGPETALINFGRGGDASAVQSILDSAN